MNEVLSWVGAISGVVAIGPFVMVKKGAQNYVDEKAKNLATLEDAAKITQEVEAVKALHLRQSHAWKWISEKEYEILRDVWEATWEFQATARSLRVLPSDARTVHSSGMQPRRGAAEESRYALNVSASSACKRN